MNYNEAIDYIKSLEKFGSKPGLERIKALMKFADNPEKKLKFIHVAGTNGKGSTCQFINQGLIEARKKTGLFTSPSIKSYLERFKINNKEMSKKKFAKYVEFFKNCKAKYTEFELSTAIAIKYFYDEKCDYVVLETGMGGLLDATNIIPKPEVTVITPISYDHMAILGDSLTLILKQKMGIIKDKCPVISSKQKFILKNLMLSYHPHAEFIDEASNIDINLKQTTFTYKEKEYKIKLKGSMQIENACLAIDVLNKLGIDYKYINKGLYKAYLPYRFEIKGKLILDAAHNPAGFLSLKQNLDNYFPGEKFDFIIGILADKDYETCIEVIAKNVDTLYCIKPDSPRALTAEDLAKTAEKHIKNVKIGKPDKHRKYTIMCGSFTNFS